MKESLDSPKNLQKIAPSSSLSMPPSELSVEVKASEGEAGPNLQIAALLADPQYEGHPLRAALEDLWKRYEALNGQIERLTSISDGYGSILRERNARLNERNEQHMRELQKVVRISDQYQKMLRELNDTLKVSAAQDPLTGLPNRRAVMERLSAEVALAPRRRSALSLALLDIDHFKAVNDSFGHDVGDQVLVTIGRLMNEHVRLSDMCARWGGGEFLIMLPNSGDVATDVCERLRHAIEKMVPIEGKDHSLTVSIGVTQYQHGEDVLETIRRANAALFQAKSEGRNRIVAAPALSPLKN